MKVLTSSGLSGSIFSLFAILAGPASGEETDSPSPFVAIDDSDIQARFQKGLEELREFGTGTSTEDLMTQLKERRQCDLKLARPEPGAAKLKASEVYERARQATLVFGHLYQCGKCDKWHPGMAGAVVVDSAGIAVTNYHVMDKPTASVFGAMSADGQVYPVVEVLAASPDDDLAIVRLSGGPFNAAPVSVGDPVGSEIRVISHPDGRFYTFSEGVIARYSLDPEKKSPRLQITADYARGSSGCGVFNESGQLTGVVASTNSIYYTETEDQQRNLQMVVKSCIPAASIRALTGSPGSSQ